MSQVEHVWSEGIESGCKKGWNKGRYPSGTEEKTSGGGDAHIQDVKAVFKMPVIRLFKVGQV